MRRLLIIYTLLFGFLSLQAQDSRALLKKANKLFEAQAYHQAIESYTDLLMFDNVLEAKENLAHCHRLVGEFKQAEYWYRIIMPQLNDRKLEFNLAQALQGQEKYKEAARYYNSYADVYPRSAMFADACKNIKQFYTNNDNYTIENLPINSPNVEFGPVLYANNQLVFTSSRKGNKKPKNTYYAPDEEFLDLYVTQPFVSTWSTPKKLGGNINSQFHDGPATFDKYFQSAWFTRNTDARGKGLKEQTRKLHLQLFNATILENGKWGESVEFPYNSNDYTVAHPSLSENGQLLYFSSNMPGGYGGADLYVCVKVDTTWSYPKNLGPDINTPDDEQFPYIHKDGTLYFSSNGHPGVGGYDIFFSKPYKRKWSQPQNMGAPVNSAKDDFSIVFDTRTKGGYFASNREGGKGQDDIYRFRTNGSVKYPKTIVGTQQIEEAQFASVNNQNIIDGSNEIVETRVIEPQPEIVNSKKKKKEKKPNNKPSNIKKQKKEKAPKATKNKVDKPKKQKKAKTEAPKKEKPVKQVKPKKDKSVKPIKKQKKEATKNVVANNEVLQVPATSLNAELKIGAVQFKGKSAIMTEDVLDQISPVIIYARENPRTKIRIESFTDSRGNNRSNVDLSKLRLSNISKFFYDNGIPQTQLEFVARGETGILNNCVEGVDCSTAKHRFNQRIIFSKKDRNTKKITDASKVLPAPEEEEYIDFEKNKPIAEKEKKASKKKRNEKSKTKKAKKKKSVEPINKENLPTPKVTPTKNLEGFTYTVIVGPYSDFSIEQKFILNSLNLEQKLITVQATKKKIELNRLAKLTDAEQVAIYLKAQGFKKTKVAVYRNGKITDYSLKDMKKLGQ